MPTPHVPIITYAAVCERLRSLAGMTVEEAALEEMRQMAGLTVRYPAPEAVERLVNDARMTESLRKDPSPANRARLRRFYGVTDSVTSRIVRAGMDKSV